MLSLTRQVLLSGLFALLFSHGTGRQLAMEYGHPYGIRVLAINPGTIRTVLAEDQLRKANKTVADAGLCIFFATFP